MCALKPQNPFRVNVPYMYTWIQWIEWTRCANSNPSHAGWLEKKKNQRKYRVSETVPIIELTGINIYKFFLFEKERLLIKVGGCFFFFTQLCICEFFVGKSKRKVARKGSKKKGKTRKEKAGKRKFVYENQTDRRPASVSQDLVPTTSLRELAYVLSWSGARIEVCTSGSSFEATGYSD